LAWHWCTGSRSTHSRLDDTNPESRCKLRAEEATAETVGSAQWPTNRAQHNDSSRPKLELLRDWCSPALDLAAPKIGEAFTVIVSTGGVGASAVGVVGVEPVALLRGGRCGDNLTLGRGLVETESRPPTTFSSKLIIGRTAGGDRGLVGRCSGLGGSAGLGGVPDRFDDVVVAVCVALKHRLLGLGGTGGGVGEMPSLSPILLDAREQDEVPGERALMGVPPDATWVPRLILNFGETTGDVAGRAVGEG